MFVTARGISPRMKLLLRGILNLPEDDLAPLVSAGTRFPSRHGAGRFMSSLSDVVKVCVSMLSVMVEHAREPGRDIASRGLVPDWRARLYDAGWAMSRVLPPTECRYFASRDRKIT